jgi:hypothetical protein
MTESSYSKIAKTASPLIRKYLDLAIKKMGSFVEVLRITSTGRKDAYGRETSVTLSSGAISNVVLNYPLGEIELFDSVKNQDLNISSVNLAEILPVTLYTSFSTDITSGELTNLERGDYIVHVLRDHKANKIPIKLQIERMVGSFYDKTLVTLQYEASLVRGKLNSTAEAMITEYVNNLEEVYYGTIKRNSFNF